jgi:hypothetical protein
MAFSDFKNVFEVSAKYGTRIQKDRLFDTTHYQYDLPDFYRKDLQYALDNKKPTSSEIAVSENFISPMIRLVAQHHPHLTYWSREYEMRADDLLFGKPDYLFSYRENIKEVMYGMPLVCVAEAKIDDFMGAWGQALAEMVACEKLFPKLIIYGWATNGTSWEFAKLENNVFVQDEISYSLSSEPHKIAGILNHIFTTVVKGAEEYLAKNPEKIK